MALCLLQSFGMKIKTPPLEIHIGSFHNQSIDPILEASGFTHGMLAFSLPSLGISFKCRASGSQLDLEFGAFFSALKFVQTKIKKQKIKRVRVCSSLPEFVFSFMPGSKNMAPDSTRYKMLKEYAKSLQVEVSFVELHQNQTRLSPGDFPLLPKGQKPVLKPNYGDIKKISSRPFQKGIEL